MPSQQLNASLSTTFYIQQVVNNVTANELTPNSMFESTYVDVIKTIVYNKFNPSLFRVIVQISFPFTTSVVAAKVTNQRYILSTKSKSDATIQCRIQLFFPSPAVSSSNSSLQTLSQLQSTYESQLMTQVQSGFSSGNFSQLFKKSCLLDCGGDVTRCAKCSVISFQTPTIRNSPFVVVSSVPTTSVPSSPSQSTSNGIAGLSLSTPVLVGVIMGVLLSISLIVWICVYFCYGKGKSQYNDGDGDDVLEKKDGSKERDNDSYIYARKSLSFTGANDMQKKNGKKKKKDREIDIPLDEMHRPVSTELKERYSVAFDYIDTFLQRKTEIVYVNRSQNPVVNKKRADVDTGPEIA